MYPYFSKKDKNIAAQSVEAKDLDDLIENRAEDKTEEDDFRRYIIEALEDAIENQQENSIYYEKLYNIVTNEKDKDILRQISLDEMKYKKIFMDIYKMLTGKEAKIRENYEDIDIDDSLGEELFDSIEEQLEDVEFYRMLMSLFADLPVRDMIYEIIVGKQKNSQRLSNLYNKYK
nr:ferritin-like domain-containing protein [uncultured Tyzzerella sp.]